MRTGRTLQPIWLHTSDAQRLYAIRGGAGLTGVGAGARVPARRRLRLASVRRHARTGRDARRRLRLPRYGPTCPYRGGRPPFAYGRDLTAAVAQLRADGAKRVAVLGASLGGAVAMTYASGVEGRGQPLRRDRAAPVPPRPARRPCRTCRPRYSSSGRATTPISRSPARESSSTTRAQAASASCCTQARGTAGRSSKTRRTRAERGPWCSPGSARRPPSA